MKNLPCQSSFSQVFLNNVSTFHQRLGHPSFASYACFDTFFVVVQVWNMKTLSLVHTISGLHHWVRALVVSQDKVM